jgi:hypothetical protein
MENKRKRKQRKPTVQIVKDLNRRLFRLLVCCVAETIVSFCGVYCICLRVKVSSFVPGIKERPAHLDDPRHTSLSIVLFKDGFL